MLIWWSRMAAIAMILLPIGGLTYQAQAISPAEPVVACGGWSVLGVIAEPGTMGLIIMGSLWLLVRCVGRGRRSVD